MSPLINDYVVGIVVPKAGINERQLVNIGHRLDLIVKALPSFGLIHVYVPGFAAHEAEQSVVRPLRNLLERKGRVRQTYLPMAGDHKAGVARQIIHELSVVRRCDEVWCCPAEGQHAGSVARCAQVWSLAQAGQHGARPQSYKQIQPWVEPPTPTNVKEQPKKGKKSWRDMWNKQSFR